MSKVTDPQPSSGAMHLLGSVIVVVAILWLALSGLCTAGGLLIGIAALFSSYSNASLLEMALLIGGGAIGIGLVALWIGRKIQRRPNA